MKRGRRQWGRQQLRRGQARRRREATGAGMHDKAGKCQAWLRRRIYKGGWQRAGCELKLR